MCICTCVCVCVHACVRACVHACMRACVHAYMHAVLTSFSSSVVSTDGSKLTSRERKSDGRAAGGVAVACRVAAGSVAKEARGNARPRPPGRGSRVQGPGPGWSAPRGPPTRRTRPARPCSLYHIPWTVGLLRLRAATARTQPRLSTERANTPAAARQRYDRTSGSTSSGSKHSPAKSGQTKTSRVKPSQAKPSQARISQAKPK